jgi:low temperature requirement protein LtrA
VPDLGHRRRLLSGRDPHEPHRAATPLELLYDLVFVVAFGQAANELAHWLIRHAGGCGRDCDLPLGHIGAYRSTGLRLHWGEFSVLDKRGHER